MIFLDIAVVSLSNIPLGMFLLYAGTKTSNSPFTTIETLLIIIAQLISTIQVFGSFYFYMIVSSAFRNNVKKLLHSIVCCGKPNIGHRIGPSTLSGGVPPTAPAAARSVKMSSVVM